LKRRKMMMTLGKGTFVLLLLLLLLLPFNLVVHGPVTDFVKWLTMRRISVKR
jgi:hypothetical protein